MKERPILFSAPMIRAILAGEKTQTRRVVKPQPIVVGPWGEWAPLGPISYTLNDMAELMAENSPYTVGDRLWVRETHDILDGRPDTVLYDVAPIPEEDWTAYVSYRATDTNEKLQAPASAWKPEYDSDQVKWRPSIFMPRWASRITLEITDVRCERLQAITSPDAIAEGCVASERASENDAYRNLWDSINVKRAPWESNPWVWVVSFKHVEPSALEQAA